MSAYSKKNHTNQPTKKKHKKQSGKDIHVYINYIYIKYKKIYNDFHALIPLLF